MCGICGKLNFDRREPVSRSLLRRMTDSLVHRGPDGSGEFVSGPIALGHRRLSIIDLDTGAQPMANEDGSVQVVFNGEIYNFAELRRELIAKGHRFRSSSDTEVIVHLYEDIGADCVKRLQGMFAFALWDGLRRRLLLARDRVGIKPLYYANTGRSLVFASEVKAVLTDPSIRRQVDPAAIDRFLTYYYLPGNETAISGIRKLEPGHYLVVEGNGRARNESYWDLSFSAPLLRQSLAQSAEQLHRLLDHTVRDHLISDVPVGVLLSGGVDSTGVLHFASRHAAQQLHTFTMGFAGTAVQDERPYARLASRSYATVHHDTSMSAEEFRNLLPLYVWHMEEPVCEPPAIALFLVANLARSAGVKVLLSGEGGDEAFAGYQNYRNLAALEAIKAGLGPARSLMAPAFGALASAGWSRGRHYRELVALAVPDYYLSRTASPDTPFNRLKETLYRGGQLNGVHAGSSALPTRRLFEAVTNHPILNQLLYVDTKTWLPDDLLVKADKMAMAASVELRVPLLDHRVLEFAASLPAHHKVMGWETKRVLKKALAPHVPEPILRRRKAGFPIPYDQWMRHDLRDYIHDTLLDPTSFTTEYFEKPVVERLLDAQEAGHGCSKEVFSLLTLELWHERFVRARLTRSADPAQPSLSPLDVAA
jgi:asparagine synthase (glutamine-hydrolysing)